MRYEDALAFLREREQFHVKVGTRNIRLLAKALGHPERRFPSVVVAGTNGKGSTVAILDSILRAHGLRVGRFTSPHLVSINERILVNGRQLPNEEFADLVGAIASAARGLLPDQQPSFFETITGAAFLAFARHGLDAAVFEVGMGGRWDATTATDAPLGLVTRIALDHERYLGRTVAEIAGEKGAVARPGGELLIAPQEPEAAAVLQESARKRGARARDLAVETETDFTDSPCRGDRSARYARSHLRRSLAPAPGAPPTRQSGARGPGGGTVLRARGTGNARPRAGP